MHVIGIVAEYNPFHKGHIYQINKIKELYPNSLIIVVVNSTFTQRGDLSIINKWNKTKILLDNNIDIVLELPFVYATQSADIFAKGALTILNKMKIDTLIFGTESDNIDNLINLAKIQLNNKEYDTLVKNYLKLGLNYPTSMSKALKDLANEKIEKPNDLLALSYIKEIIKNNYPIKPISIKRTNDYHMTEIKNDIISASLIRKLHNNKQDISNYLPKEEIKYLYNISLDNYFSYLKYQILTNINNLNKFQTVDEGIENKIIKNINKVNSWQELVMSIKNKRFTYNKINRMLIHILTSFTKEQANNIEIDYIRLLGFNKQGRNYLNKIKKNIDIPLITNYKKDLSSILDIELRITNIYDLVTKDNLTESEYKNKPIMK